MIKMKEDSSFLKAPIKVFEPNKKKNGAVVQAPCLTTSHRNLLLWGKKVIRFFRAVEIEVRLLR